MSIIVLRMQSAMATQRVAGCSSSATITCHAKHSNRRCGRAEPSRGNRQTYISAASMSSSPSKACQPLLDWVQESGGYVHPALTIVDEAPCGGGRGLVCSRDLTEEEVAGMPMLLVPEDLLLTSAVARYGFENHYEPMGAPPLQELDQATQLAVMLAHERLEGEDSFYHLYVSTLPDKAPCAWSLDAKQLTAKLEALLPHLGEEGVEAWRQEVMRNRLLMERHAQGAEDRYKKYFPLTADGFFWAMGQVLSRAFSSHPSLALMPVIDMCNHKAGADHPELVSLGGDESDRCYSVSSVSGCTSWQPLKSGEELLIRYFDSSTPVSASNGAGPSSRGDGTQGSTSPAASGQLPLLLHGMAGQAGASQASQLVIPAPEALLCFLSHGHVFPEYWQS